MQLSDFLDNGLDNLSKNTSVQRRRLAFTFISETRANFKNKMAGLDYGKDKHTFANTLIYVCREATKNRTSDLTHNVLRGINTITTAAINLYIKHFRPTDKTTYIIDGKEYAYNPKLVKSDLQHSTGIEAQVAAAGPSRTQPGVDTTHGTSVTNPQMPRSPQEIGSNQWEFSQTRDDDLFGLGEDISKTPPDAPTIGNEERPLFQSHLGVAHGADAPNLERLQKGKERAIEDAPSSQSHDFIPLSERLKKSLEKMVLQFGKQRGHDKIEKSLPALGQDVGEDIDNAALENSPTLAVETTKKFIKFAFQTAGKSAKQRAFVFSRYRALVRDVLPPIYFEFHNKPTKHVDYYVNLEKETYKGTFDEHLNEIEAMQAEGSQARDNTIYRASESAPNIERPQSLQVEENESVEFSQTRADDNDLFAEVPILQDPIGKDKSSPQGAQPRVRLPSSAPSEAVSRKDLPKLFSQESVYDARVSELSERFEKPTDELARRQKLLDEEKTMEVKDTYGSALILAAKRTRIDQFAEVYARDYFVTSALKIMERNPESDKAKRMLLAHGSELAGLGNRKNIDRIVALGTYARFRGADAKEEKREHADELRRLANTPGAVGKIWFEEIESFLQNKQDDRSPSGLSETLQSLPADVKKDSSLRDSYVPPHLRAQGVQPGALRPLAQLVRTCPPESSSLPGPSRTGPRHGTPWGGRGGI